MPMQVEAKPVRRALIEVSLPVAFTVLIFIKGSAPADPSSIQVNDKLAHAVVFFGLALCCGPLAGYWMTHRSVTAGRAVVSCAAYSMFVGAALEVWQSRIPHRTADVWDWVADTVGALLAAAVLRLLLPRYITWRSHHPG